MKSSFVDRLGGSSRSARLRRYFRSCASQDHEGMRRPMAGDEGDQPDRRHEISGLQQAMHVRGSAGRRSPAAAEARGRCAAAGRGTGREAVRRAGSHGGPDAGLWRRMEDRQGRRQRARRTEVAAILERVQQAQKSRGDVTASAIVSGRGRSDPQRNICTVAVWRGAVL